MMGKRGIYLVYATLSFFTVFNPENFGYLSCLPNIMETFTIFTSPG